MKLPMVQKHRRTGFESLVGGKKKIIETVENNDEVFVEILKDHTAGSSIDKDIKWTNLSLKEISKDFESKNMNITPHVVKQLLKKHGFVERKIQKTVTMKDCKDRNEQFEKIHELKDCLLYTSDAADEEDSVDLGGRRIIRKKKTTKQ